MRVPPLRGNVGLAATRRGLAVGSALGLNQA
jgi:hypothetical protein